ncbi:TPA: VWA domain-containing protein [Burkholderia lata]
MQKAVPNVSMRHLYLYVQLLIAVARKDGIAVRIEWDNIRTAAIGPDPLNSKGLRLKLPQMAATGTDEDADLLQGLISHEIVCHGLHTDFSVIPRESLLKQILNILEDPRGEHLGARRYPGSRRVIRRTLDILMSRGYFAFPDTDVNHPAEILGAWLVSELRNEVLQQDCFAERAVAWRDLATEIFGEDLLGKVKAAALEGAYAASTSEALDSARKILDLLQMAHDDSAVQDENPEQNPDPQPGGEPNDNGDNTDDPEPSPEPQSGSKSDADGNDNKNQQPGNPSGPDKKQLAKVIAQVLSATPEEVGNYGKGLEEVICEASEAIQSGGLNGSHTDQMTERSLVQQDDGVANRALLRAGARATAASLSLKMEDLLEAQSKVRRRKATTGSIRPNRLWRVPLGDMQVFHRTTREEKLDTCVYLLADDSQSMDEVFDTEQSPHLHAALVDPKKQDQTFDVKRKEAAGRVAVAVGEVLHGADIPFGMASFNETVCEWKSFDGDWSSTLLNYHPTSTNGTNTHLAVVWALQRLAARSEARKVLIVVCDGDPGDEVVLESALVEAAFHDVEVCFVLIGEAEVARYEGLSASHGVATNVRELAKAVFGALETALS